MKRKAAGLQLARLSVTSVDAIATQRPHEQPQMHIDKDMTWCKLMSQVLSTMQENFGA